MISRFRKLHLVLVLALALALTITLILISAFGLFRADNETSSTDEKARASFIEACKQQGRAANGGGQLRMDDVTEEKLDLYCSCVADHFGQALTSAEIEAVGAGSASQETLAKLNNVVTTCQIEHLAPDNTDQPSN